ncbi:hypothetical protein JHW43_002092 [Diplocarpon mali]|nr:hypothetical protein JHW43_002092 [Diplocarpon mali]
MANWDPDPRPRDTARLSARGIFASLDLGLFSTRRGASHPAPRACSSRKMRERLLRLGWQEEERAAPARDPPPQPRERVGDVHHSRSRMPGMAGCHDEKYPPEQEEPYQPRGRSSVRTTGSRQTGTPAPPTLSEPMSSTSPTMPAGAWDPNPHRSNLPRGRMEERLERPLPPLPSQFRLGEDGLPWSTEPWYVDPESDDESATTTSPEPGEARPEDPQRIGALGNLQQALMTVDSLPRVGWEPWTWDSREDAPLASKSLGWAVRSEEVWTGPDSPTPPPYTALPWEDPPASGGWYETAML